MIQTLRRSPDRNRKLGGKALVGKSIILREVRPNAGVAAAYRARLIAMVDAMDKSVRYWVEAQYKANPPDEFGTVTVLAMDDRANFGSTTEGSSANALRKAMSKLAWKWQKAFNNGARDLARYFTDKSMDAADGQLKGILKRAGFSVEFKMTNAARNAYQAVLAQNVALISNIAEQHLAGIEGAVMRSVATGRDLKSLSTDLQKQYGITKRRAAFIAIDQNNKATAVVTKVRQQGLGITQAMWRHSHAGVHPRPEHVAADGKTYDVAKGMFLESKWVWPGTEPRCRCTSRSVIKGFNA